MVKWAFRTLTAILLVLAALFAHLLISGKGAEPAPGQEYEYHIQIAVRDTDEYFWQLFQKGAQQAGEESSAYIEFVPVLPRDPDSLRVMVEQGVNAKVDALALQAVDVNQTADIVSRALEQNIPVLTYESDTFTIPGVPMVSSNSYTIGMIAGEMAASAVGDNARAIVILGNPGAEAEAQTQNLIIQGIMEGSAKAQGFTIKSTHELQTELFEAEDLRHALFSRAADINVVICMDERSTPAIAQMLVDENRVGDIAVIGYGVMPQTLDYIERGVIYGSVCPDAREIGYYTVKGLADSLNGLQVSDSFNPDVERVDRSNVDWYRS
ncbi:MAG TPA: substrate-binding domain-containing protein [Feifaniaceae bacterium]|nr:substrate-binding domain-containing protein [Feifaniaceae bacterium]